MIIAAPAGRVAIRGAQCARVLSEVRRDRGVIAARHVRLIMSIRTPADDWSVLVERARVRVTGGDRDI